MAQVLPLSPGRVAVLVTGCAVLAGILLTGGGMFSPGPLRAQPRGSAAFGGVTAHAGLARTCSACHPPPWSGETMADRCTACHTDVRAQLDSGRALHGRFANGTRCRSCHTEHKGAHAAITDLSAFDHACTAFPLTGKHAAVECQRCHTGGTYRGAPATCAACHAEPKVHVGKFGTECARCHTTATWRASTFPAATGADRGGFDHSTTAFPLTGKHTATECARCHKPNAAGETAFKGAPTSCAACHAEPKAHFGKFGTDCAKCHTTTAWAGATLAGYKHTFPIAHGQKRSTGANACSTCHKGNDAYATYTCYGCHEHNPAKVARQHKKFANIDDCAKCHKTARGGERERERAAAEFGDALFASAFADRCAPAPGGAPRAAGTGTFLCAADSSLAAPPDGWPHAWPAPAPPAPGSMRHDRAETPAPESQFGPTGARERLDRLIDPFARVREPLSPPKPALVRD